MTVKPGSARLEGAPAMDLELKHIRTHMETDKTTLPFFLVFFVLCRHTMIELGIPPFILQQRAPIGSPSLQIHCSPHKHNRSKTLQPQVQISLQ